MGYRGIEKAAPPRVCLIRSLILDKNVYPNITQTPRLVCQDMQVSVFCQFKRLVAVKRQSAILEENEKGFDYLPGVDRSRKNECI